MKNSNYLSKAAISIAIPALSAWLLAGRDFSAELLLGAYTLSGLFFITLADYSTRRVFSGKATAKPRHHWIRASLNRSLHKQIAHREEKIPA